jgi:pimeloyl-ACP methyl ester carboxylesterase
METLMTKTGRWTEVEIAGKPADVYEPAHAPAEPRAILFLHGHGGERLTENRAFTAEFERHGLRVVCPQGKRSWWLDVLCDEFDSRITPLAYLRDEVIPFVKDRFHVVPPAIGLLGVSMGGQGVLQFAYREARRFPVVAAISPAIDFHRCYGQGLPLDRMFASAEDARQETAILKIHPLNWPRHQLLVCDPADEYWFEGAERLCLKLSSSGILFESDFQTSAGGHTWEYFNRMAAPVISVLAERLDREIQVSRRP